MSRIKTLVLVLFPFAFGIIIGIKAPSSITRNNVLGEETEVLQENKKQKKLVYQEISPDGQKKIILYEMPFLGKGDLDFRNYLTNQHLFVVESPASGREYQVFVGDYKAGYPRWLGNEHIFFTGGCGTGCQTLYLVNVNSKEARQGLLEFTPLDNNKTQSQFFDWFGRKLAFDGGIENIRSITLDDQTYLIFRIVNPGESPRERKFLFTKNQLKAL